MRDKQDVHQDAIEQGAARAELEEALEEIKRLSDRLRGENLAQRASEHELSLIVEMIPGLVWCASPDGELTYVNQRILDYTGTTRRVGARLMAQVSPP